MLKGLSQFDALRGDCMTAQFSCLSNVSLANVSLANGGLANGGLVNRGLLVGCCLLLACALADTVHAETVVFEELFENGNSNGWIMGGADDTASAGAWEFGDPEGTYVLDEPAQPEDAFQGVACAMTAQNPGAIVGFDDVDNGVVYLISPMLDLSPYSAVRLEYTRWYYLRDLDVDPTDYFIIQVRESASSEWIDLERLDDSTVANTWTLKRFALESFVDLTQTVQLRFGASDGVLAPLGNISEAAVDEFRVFGTFDCDTNEDCDTGQYCSAWGGCQPFGNGDIDADGDTDLADYGACLDCVGSISASCAPCNIVGGETVALDDALEFGQRMSGPQ